MNRSILLLVLGALALFTAAAQARSGATARPVILTTDIGDDIDDTWALGLLLRCPELDPRLIVSDYGKPHYRTRLIGRLLQEAGRTDIPIALGRFGPSPAGDRQDAWVRDYRLEDYPGPFYRDGVGAMIDVIMKSPEPVTVIAIGPMPNVAEALRREPRIAQRARFVGMHGSVRRGYGNSSSPAPEYNVVRDVAACRAAFEAPWPKLITPLDTCGVVQLGGERYARLQRSKDPLVRAILENYRIWDEGRGGEPQWRRQSSILFDTVAVYLAVTQDLVKVESLPIAVTDAGMTEIRPGAPVVEVASEWRDLKSFLDWMIDRLDPPAPARSGEMRRIGMAELEDRVRGGWAGQMIGVSYGAPTEFRYRGATIEGEIPWRPDMVANSIDQDDLYVEMTFSEVMDRVGLDATSRDYGRAFRDSEYRLWHANAGARRLLNLGIDAPDSGHPRYNIHANDIDFQIEADFIGLMTPGLPRESNRFCDRVGRVMNWGDGLYGGMFVAGMYSAAFFEQNPARVVDAGLACIPSGSGYAAIIRDVIRLHREHPSDWRACWQGIQDRWDKDDPCPDGALRSFNIDARLNGAYIAIGLLYGEGDFGRTTEITTRCGQDSDCNPASAAGVLGVMLGWSRIPEEWRGGIPAIADKPFAFTKSSLNQVIASTIRRAGLVAARAGGRVADDALFIPDQKPRAPALEQWDMGRPLHRAEASDAAWTWTSDWKPDMRDGRPTGARTAASAGAEARFRFEGTAVAILGRCSPRGGRADVWLDGRKQPRIDAYVTEKTFDNALWHIYGLPAGRHEVRIVARGDADSRSSGRDVTLQTAIIFGQ